MKKGKTIADINTAKYPLHPTWDEIQDFITETGMSYNRFERYYGIPFNQITQIKKGDKKLCPKYWHFIFERIKPKFGAGFTEEYSFKRPKLRINKVLPLTLPSHSLELSDSHDRTGTLT